MFTTQTPPSLPSPSNLCKELHTDTQRRHWVVLTPILGSDSALEEVLDIINVFVLGWVVGDIKVHSLPAPGELGKHFFHSRLADEKGWWENCKRPIV